MKTRIKKVQKSAKQKRQSSASYFRLVVMLSVAVVVLYGSKSLVAATQKVHVLGAQTGPVLLADNNTDGGGDSQDQQPSTTPQPGDQNQQNTNNPTPTGDNQQQQPNQMPPQKADVPSLDSKQVDCVGPDGKHFTVDFKGCQELNQKWGQTNFQFTPLNVTPTPVQNEGNDATQQPDQKSAPELPKTHTTIVTPNGTLEIQSEGNKVEVNGQNATQQIQLKTEDNGQLSLTAKNQNGTSVQLQSQALSTINEALKEQNIEIGTSSANQLSITSQNVQALTTLPISLNPQTNTLSVTTPQGTKNLTVLPNQAVSTVLQQNLLSSITSQISSSGSSSATTQLTVLNNQPVFAVDGVLQKKLLGLFPIGYAKTVYVSATNGQVVSTTQSPLNAILEAFSL